MRCTVQMKAGYLGGRTAGAGLGGKGGSGFFVPLDHEIIHHQLIDHGIADARTAQPLRPIRPIDLRSAPTLHALPAMGIGRFAPAGSRPRPTPGICTARGLRDGVRVRQRPPGCCRRWRKSYSTPTCSFSSSAARGGGDRGGWAHGVYTASHGVWVCTGCELGQSGTSAGLGGHLWPSSPLSQQGRLTGGPRHRCRRASPPGSSRRRPRRRRGGGGSSTRGPTGARLRRPRRRRW